MTMNHLPPQAYTKDTLVHAYNWLQTQPQKIKELAVSQDVLVSLYSKAKLHGDAIFEKPSFQNFRNDLKSIANMMGEFDSTQPNNQISQTQGNSSQIVQQQNSQQQVNTNGSNQSHNPHIFNHPLINPINNQSNSNPTQRMSVQVQSSQIQTTHHQIETPIPGNFSVNTNQSLDYRNLDLMNLDPKSLSMVREVRDHFNLSSDAEAVRLLISIGFQKIRTQF